MKTIHLTHTGSMAGQTYCGAARAEGADYAHGIYAPLTRADYRACVCPQCLTRSLAYAVIDGEEQDWPTWPTTPEEVARIESEIGSVPASREEVDRFRAFLRGRRQFARTGVPTDLALELAATAAKSGPLTQSERIDLAELSLAEDEAECGKRKPLCLLAAAYLRNLRSRAS